MSLRTQRFSRLYGDADSTLEYHGKKLPTRSARHTQDLEDTGNIEYKEIFAGTYFLEKGRANAVIYLPLPLPRIKLTLRYQ